MTAVFQFLKLRMLTSKAMIIKTGFEEVSSIDDACGW
jgi:hypothetical protein